MHIRNDSNCFVGTRLVLSFVVAVVVVVGSAPNAHGSGGLQPDTAQTARGNQTFKRVGCYQCHGREAQGASTGPRLGPAPLTPEAFARAVRTPRNDMPPYSLKLLSDADLADVYAFVAARARPHQLPR